MSHHSYLLIFIKIVATTVMLFSIAFLLGQLVARYKYMHGTGSVERLMHARYGLVPVYRIWQPIVIILICIGVLLYQP